MFKKLILILIVIFLALFFYLGNDSVMNDPPEKITLKGVATQSKGGLVVEEMIIPMDFEEIKKYEGKMVELTGILGESECEPYKEGKEVAQCFDGLFIKEVESIKILEE